MEVRLLRIYSNQLLSSIAKKLKAFRIAIYFFHCVELLFKKRLIAFLVLEGFCISSKRLSEKGEVFLYRKHFSSCNKMTARLRVR